jgi:hypothetical protein
MRNRAITLHILVFIVFNLFADEGMWLPNLIHKLNIDDMQSKGLKLSAEDIYSVNHSSLKDAIVSFGGFCTAEVISKKGLILTNHHCGYGQIQRLSSVENDYLKNGFWAMNNQEELPNEGLTASFIVSIEEVTDSVLSHGTKTRTGKDRQRIIDANIKKIKEAAIKDNHYEAEIKPFFHGNRYFLIIKEIFKDVRLVGTPPESIGKFGGDTDNWMWPRHTGDFSIFRIYADTNNMPAEYSKNNVPYTPKHHLPISLKGVEENDFTMIFGFPGRTNEYLLSNEIDFIKNTLNPIRIHIREEKMDVLKSRMESSDKIRIQYSAKYARLSNYYKKWKGENMGLKRSRAIENKIEEESDFSAWAKENEYKGVISTLGEYCDLSHNYQLMLNVAYEAGLGIDLFYFSYLMERFLAKYDFDDDASSKNQELKKKQIKRFRDLYRDFDIETDMQVSRSLLPIMNETLSEIGGANVLYNQNFFGDISAFIDRLYSKSFMTDSTKVISFIRYFSENKLKKAKKDPAISAGIFLSGLINKTRISYKPIKDSVFLYQGKYLSGLIEKNKSRSYYPNANSTLRLAYGKVEPYYPKNGVCYDLKTTQKGIMQKNASGDKDYVLPPKLIELFEKKDFGEYAQNGILPVCFIASNHTTGGNSGSPVINSKGEFIGINFDRNWEGTMSDLNYDISICRNIAVDARYIMFIVDKFAGAGYLLDEMTLRK